jgi:twitching motility protein PilT
MAAIDSLLGLLIQQGGNELRVATGVEPKMFAAGVARRTSFPATSEETLRELLGELWTPERAAIVAEGKRVELDYESARLGAFHLVFTPHPSGFQATFRRIGKIAHAVSVPTAPSTTAARPSTPEVVVHVEEPLAPLATSHLDAPELRVDRRRDRPLVRGSLDDLIVRASTMRASDLHLAEGAHPAVRIDGSLETFTDLTTDDLSEWLALTPAQRATIAEGRALDLALEVARSIRARLHVYQTAAGLCAAVRLLPNSSTSFAQLQLGELLEPIVDFPNGLVLIAGSAGSGKSTTLAAIAQEILRRRSVVMVTLEDPIELPLNATDRSIVRRRQVHRDVRDFTSGLRDALREDPDVIVVGELRDPETIALALTAAETGHLVLATVHSRSAPSAVQRILDGSPAERQPQVRAQLADALRAVVSQRLLPRARGEGRVPALEVLRLSSGVASLIREGKVAQLATAMQAGRAEGMVMLERSLADRVSSGVVRLEDARAAANDQAVLTNYLSTKNL